FYNYIYMTVAGFTENDTFRSCQIREGLLSRDQAIKITENENKPRIETLEWYGRTVGFDCDKTIRIINRVPKLYKI
ncbi:MAG: glucosamine 6-phosphate synthetase, partial [Candidatus Omnitrophica bacterium]|nr:glucosamine 6-phosphate synthetase [Candidatus Omnitrophota bacterium]